jgi:flagellar protein FlaG
MAVANVGYIQVSPTPAVENRTQASKPQSTQSETKANPKIYSTAADMQRIGQAINKKLQFVVDHSSNEVIVKVIDKETDKVIKVIPPEELQRLHRNLKETIGLLLDEMV